jgi:hypothetical protein
VPRPGGGAGRAERDDVERVDGESRVFSPVVQPHALGRMRAVQDFHEAFAFKRCI